MKRHVFIRTLVVVLVILLLILITERPKKNRQTALPGEWRAPDTSQIPHTAAGDQIRYGRELIVHTARFLGPKGIVASVSNGMNCENCHLEAGTRPWGNNFGAVAATYPKFRARSGSVESIEKKINDCLERSLNGSTIDSAGREMQAMVAYIRWVGKDVAKGKKPGNAGIRALSYLPYAADTARGRQVFVLKCTPCHGADGQGKINSSDTGYQYPPLWGPHSYNMGAGIYRLSRFAGYVRDNMPFDSTRQQPRLSDEEAWNVAAFINSQPRPSMDLQRDWPDIGAKPVDHPFGPYTDTFSETQHKYGPFGPIQKVREAEQKTVKNP